jgi:hypothetical protein
VRRGGAFLFTLAAALAAVAAGGACGQPAPAESQGGTCEQSTDCQEGYVCITQPNGSRQCSNDLSSIQSTEEAGGMDATAPQNDATTPPQDGTTPPQESGSPPQESGSPPKDSGTPPKEAGNPPQDTGSPPQDTGSPPQETGTGDDGGGD